MKPHTTAEPSFTLSPEYIEIRDLLRSRMRLSQNQAEGIALWLEHEYDPAPNDELRAAYFEWLAREEGAASTALTPPTRVH
jgi:hypothetical protein